MNLLKYGDTIGIISPSWVANQNDYEKYAKGIEKLGFQVKFGRNIYKDTYRYTASVTERVDDLNEMIYDEDVKMVFWGGGYGSVDLLPYIDYKKIKETPKLFLSYSDGTSILNAIYAQTDIVTYYGQTPGLFDNISEYDEKQFITHLVEGTITDYISNSDWYTITEGCCEGVLVGGYLLNFALALGNRFFPYPTDRNYILFIEELDKFQSVQDVSMFLTCIGQSRLMERVTGLLFGHYSDDISPFLFEVLERFGKKYSIPVAYCDDFGHGTNHAIFPIGGRAVLDTKNKTLFFSVGHHTSKMENQINFIQIQKDNEEHFKIASKLWVPFICEVKEHDGTYEDEEQIRNGLKKRIAIQGCRKDMHFEIAFVNGEPFGIAMFAIDLGTVYGLLEKGYGTIMGFYIRPKFRRKGLGTILNRHIETVLYHDGAKNMYVCPDAVTGEPFWKANGYHDSGKIDPDDKKPIYTKEISGADDSSGSYAGCR